MPKLSDFRIGDDVKAHPGTDIWMRGDRTGRVVKVGKKYVTVKMDVSRSEIRFSPSNLLPKE